VANIRYIFLEIY